jgi:hypothetical protein
MVRIVILSPSQPTRTWPPCGCGSAWGPEVYGAVGCSAVATAVSVVLPYGT